MHEALCVSVSSQRRVTLQLPDGGELYVDWVDNEANNSKYPNAETRPTVLLLPGLTGTFPVPACTVDNAIRSVLLFVWQFFSQRSVFCFCAERSISRIFQIERVMSSRLECQRIFSKLYCLALNCIRSAQRNVPCKLLQSRSKEENVVPNSLQFSSATYSCRLHNSEVQRLLSNRLHLLIATSFFSCTVSIALATVYPCNAIETVLAKITRQHNWVIAVRFLERNVNVNVSFEKLKIPYFIYQFFFKEISGWMFLYLFEYEKIEVSFSWQIR